MKIKVFTNNPWQENTIVLYDETGEAVIIDCGSIVKYTFAYRSYFRE